MKKPFLTLIIPTHNRSTLLARALKSINSQDFRSEIEVIVISDIEDYKTTSLCSENLRANDIYVRRNGVPGPSASRNLGLQIANGENVMFLDDDDSWDKDFFGKLIKLNLKIQVNYFNCNVIKERRLSSGPIEINRIPIDTENRLDLNVFVKNQLHMSCLIFNRALIGNYKFDCSMRAYEDWDFLLYIYREKFPVHVPILCSNIYEVDDETTDRRGSSSDAINFNAVIDYLYVYRRHESPNQEVKKNRKVLLDLAGLNLPIDLL
jgi:GalNAc5-diNAcBac-PP-undecaprenol beta-1,3-glucosyltransferase